jgi:hypothetical protein
MKNIFRHLMASICIAAIVALPCQANEDTTNRIAEPFQICSINDELMKLNIENTATEHGGGLNACGCHFNRKTGECHCHQARSCGCSCQPATCR